VGLLQSWRMGGPWVFCIEQHSSRLPFMAPTQSIAIRRAFVATRPLQPYAGDMEGIRFASLETPSPFDCQDRCPGCHAAAEWWQHIGRQMFLCADNHAVLEPEGEPVNAQPGALEGLAHQSGEWSAQGRGTKATQTGVPPS
jgi:hypothetical protein